MMKYLFHDETLKIALINQAHIQSGQAVLDMGCGTGTVTLMIKQTQPNATLYGHGIDPQILDIAHKKADQAEKHIDLQQGTAPCLPCPNESSDHVFTSLVLHHLTRQDKQQVLQEAFCVIKLGGTLHVVDFGKPHDAVMWLISWVACWFEEVHDNILGLLPIFMAEAGFQPVEETSRYRTVLSPVALYRACKPMRND